MYIVLYLPLSWIQQQKVDFLIPLLLISTFFCSSAPTAAAQQPHVMST